MSDAAAKKREVPPPRSAKHEVPPPRSAKREAPPAAAPPAAAPPSCEVCKQKPAKWRIGPDDDSGECRNCCAQPVTREFKVCGMDCAKAWWGVSDRGFIFAEDDECAQCGERLDEPQELGYWPLN